MRRNAELQQFLKQHGFEDVPWAKHTDWGVPSMEVPPNRWFTMQHPVEIDDLEGTPISGNL